MKEGKLISIVFICAAMTVLSCTHGMEKEKADPGPAAIVVDAETGEPVEGAVVMAVWWAGRQLSWFEGVGSIVPEPMQVEETMSDKEGKIYIPDFWKKGEKPVLSVYKCGYVCWNQLVNYKKGRRYDFNKDNRTVRMEKRPEDFSFVGHYEFISSYVMMNILGHGRDLIKTFDECEVQERVDERKEYRRRQRRQK